ncbi:NUDIX domain-containing protein [soil metagenome]
MAKYSAGLLLYRIGDDCLQVLLVHPGGPFWKNKDDGAWSIPKGEYSAGEDPLAVARREFAEELGSASPEAEYFALGEVRQAGGKMVTAWAVAGDLDVSGIVSNMFEMEWPPKSGKRASFPEVDRAEWFSLDEARIKILKSQLPFLDGLDGLTVPASSRGGRRP